MANRRLSAVPASKKRQRPPDLRDAVDQAVAAMPWAEETDAALVALAKRLAVEIEEVVDRAAMLDELWSSRDLAKSDRDLLARLEAHCNATKTVGWLGPQLQGVLKELGGTPQARKAMGSSAPVGGALAAIRDSLPGAKGSRQDDAEAVDSTSD